MNFAQGQEVFKNLLINIDKSQSVLFLKWVTEITEQTLKDTDPSHDGISTENAILNEIKCDLRQSLPLEAVASSEQIVYPNTGENTDCCKETTIHIDGFLYDDDAIEDLVDQNKLSRNYCRRCGSQQVAPLTFISHSASSTQLQYIFQYLLPDLRNKLVLDVGSRLGSVLYGAYVYTGAARIIGVEMNSDLCQLQQKVIEKYHMQDRLQVVCDDICNQVELLANADVIVMNNVFEFFIDTEAQKRIWSLIQKTVRKCGTLLVICPSLETSLQHLQLLDLVNGWVEPVTRPEVLLAAETALFKDVSSSDLNDIYLYSVL